MYKCTFPGCSKTFTEDRNRRRHEALHAGVKSHVCETCGAAFARQSDLTNHQARHGSADFPCNWPGCPKAFRSANDRTAHLRRHERREARDSTGSPTKSKSPPLLSALASASSSMLGEAAAAAAVDPPERQHAHGAGCGHRLVAHDGHLDYLLENGDLAHLSDSGDWVLHFLGVDMPPPSHDLTAHLCTKSTSEPHPHLHHEHEHGPDCGHVKVLHDGHVDFLVDGLLHNTHNGHCDFHGFLNTFDNDPNGANAGALSDFLDIFQHNDSCCGSL